MSRLGDFLAGLFPGRLLDKPRISERGRSFLVKQLPGDDVIGVSLDRPSLWPGELVCDAMFASDAAGAGHLVIALVELKGGHVEHAVDQLVATARRLCRGSADPYSCHRHGVRATLGKGMHHGRRVLGVVVGRQALSQAQQKKAAARLEGIVIKSRSTKRRLETTCSELAAWVG